MILDYRKQRYYISAITIITLTIFLFVGYLYNIYTTQKKTISSQAYSLSAAKTLHELIFGSRRIIASGNQSDISLFIKEIDHSNLDWEFDSISDEESIQKYLEFKQMFLTELKLLVKLREKNYALHQKMVKHALTSYESVIKIAHSFPPNSDTYSEEEDITELFKELALTIADARQLDRDFQLEENIQRKMELVESVSKSVDAINDKLSHLKKIVANQQHDTGKNLSDLEENIQLYKQAFDRFSEIHIQYVAKRNGIDFHLENINVYLDENIAKHYQYLNRYNNATKLFLVGLVLFFSFIVIFIVFIYNAYVSSRRNQEIEKNKNQEKSHFLARMSHEIRTPLNGIIGTISLMQHDELCRSCNKKESFLETLNTSSISLKNHIDNVLDLSKIEAGVMEVSVDRFSPNVLFSQIESITKPLITNNKYKLVIEGESDFDIYTDKTKLRQIILNYVSNAIKYSDFNKSCCLIKIKYRVMPVTSDYALVQVDIEDNGIGMSEDELAQYATPFNQFGQWQNDSSGLGANVAKNYIKLLSGRVKVTSKADEGTTVTFFLKTKYTPRSEDTVQAKSLAHSDIPLNVLIIEDNIFNQKILTQQLTLLGCNVTSLNDGLEAKNHLLTGTHRYDLYITDIKMPHLDGVQLTQFIRQHISETIPVIALTADALKQDHVLFNEVGITKVLTKPILIEDLDSLISQIAERSAS